MKAITDEEIRAIYRRRKGTPHERETLDMLMWAIHSELPQFRASGRKFFTQLRTAALRAAKVAKKGTGA